MSQLTNTQYKALYGSSGTIFPDNTTQEISESDMRQFGEDNSDSFAFLDDTNIGDMIIGISQAYYIGVTTTDGTWRIVRGGNDLRFQKRESGIWVTKSSALVGMLDFELSISSAEILNSFTSPILLLPAPGANNYIEVIHMSIYYDYNTTGYLTPGGGGFFFVYGIGGSQINSSAISLPSYSQSTILNPGLSATGGGNSSGILNTAIYLEHNTANPTTGDGTLKVRIVYRIVSI